VRAAALRPRHAAALRMAGAVSRAVRGRDARGHPWLQVRGRFCDKRRPFSYTGDAETSTKPLAGKAFQFWHGRCILLNRQGKLCPGIN